MKHITRANTIENEQVTYVITGQTQTVDFSAGIYFFARYILKDRLTCALAHKVCIMHVINGIDYPPSEKYYPQVINRLLSRDIAKIHVTVTNTGLHMDIYVQTKNTIRSLLSLNLNNDENGVPFDKDYMPLFLQVKRAVQAIPGNKCGKRIADNYEHYFTAGV